MPLLEIHAEKGEIQGELSFNNDTYILRVVMLKSIRNLSLKKTHYPIIENYRKLVDKEIFYLKKIQNEMDFLRT